MNRRWLTAFVTVLALSCAFAEWMAPGLEWQIRTGWDVLSIVVALGCSALTATIITS